jgi:hypothetical protein
MSGSPVLLPGLGVAGEHDAEPHPPAFYEYGREIAYLWAWAVP